jgi:MFS family permease
MTKSKEDKGYSENLDHSETLDPDTSNNSNVPLEKESENLIPSQSNQPALKVNMGYLVKMTIIGNLGATHYGFALSITNSCINALQYQMGWIGDNLTLYETIVSSASVLGLAFGSVIGGALIKKGRKRVVITWNIIGIISCGLSMWPNTWVITAGRIIYGLTAGILTVAGSATVNETVPNHLLDKGFSQCTNISICLCILLSMILGIGMPRDNEVDMLKTTHYWQFVYAFPIIFFLLSLYLNIFVHKEDTLNFHVTNGEKEKAIRMLEKIYPTEGQGTRETVYLQLSA